MRTLSLCALALSLTAAAVLTPKAEAQKDACLNKISLRNGEIRKIGEKKYEYTLNVMNTASSGVPFHGSVTLTFVMGQTNPMSVIEPTSRTQTITLGSKAETKTVRWGTGVPSGPIWIMGYDRPAPAQSYIMATNCVAM